MKKNTYFLTCLLCASLSVPAMALPKEKPRSLIFSCESNHKVIELRRDDRHFDLNITDLKNDRVIFSESCKKSALRSNRYQREFVTGNMLTCKNEDARFTLFDYMNEEKEVVQSTGIDVQVEETKFTYYCKKNTINFIHELVQ